METSTWLTGGTVGSRSSTLMETSSGNGGVRAVATVNSGYKVLPWTAVETFTWQIQSMRASRSLHPMGLLLPSGEALAADPGQLLGPMPIDLSPDGRVYVADSGKQPHPGVREGGSERQQQGDHRGRRWRRSREPAVGRHGDERQLRALGAHLPGVYQKRCSVSLLGSD